MFAWVYWAVNEDVIRLSMLNGIIHTDRTAVFVYVSEAGQMRDRNRFPNVQRTQYEKQMWVSDTLGLRRVKESQQCLSLFPYPGVKPVKCLPCARPITTQHAKGHVLSRCLPVAHMFWMMFYHPWMSLNGCEAVLFVYCQGFSLTSRFA